MRRGIVIVAALLSLSVAGTALAALGGDEGVTGPVKTENPLPLLAGNVKVKGNGNGGNGTFVPPGQAKKWARGQYLPRTVVWTPAPVVVVRKLKPAPPGHQYVEIDGEVLLIAVATGLIIEALDVH
jgi:Nickel/cobalt transporter regulator